MSLGDAIAALDARTNYEASGRLLAPTLDRMRALVDVLAHPEQSAPTLAITGTNGKTTTAHAATEVLRATGLSVGTYTSPHVESILERVRFDGAPVAAQDFEEAWRELEPILEFVDARAGRVTWFEAMTALALVIFADRGAEALVLEVGMGGSWDATSVADATVTVFTPIGADHLGVLGPSVADVAREKAGLLKDGATGVSAVQGDDARAALLARASSVGAQLRWEGEDFALERRRMALGGQGLDLRVGGHTYRDVFLPMFGEHAAHNALLGLAGARAYLGDPDLGTDVVEEAFARITVPARMEVIQRQPLVVIDGAHNPSAARALATALRDAFRFDRLILVLGCMADKDLDGISDALVPDAALVICAAAASPRAREPEEVAAAVRARGVEARTAPTVTDAMAMAVEAANETDAVCVTGSLYVAGEARAQR